MDSEIIVWLVIIGFWLLSNLISFIRKAAAKGRAMAEQQKTRTLDRPGARQQPSPPPPPPPRPAAPEPATEDALSELLKSFGVDVETPSAHERPVASEHVRTRSEHARTISETRATMTEHDHSPGWHERTAAETTQSASERSLSLSEHRRSAGEHQAGDVFLAPRSHLAPATAHRRVGSAIGRRVVADLHRDREALARAFVLREVLGPPVGQRPPGDRSHER